MLGLNEENPLLFFCGKVHLKLMRILGIEKRNRNFFTTWFVTSYSIIGTQKDVFDSFEPAFDA